MKWTYSIKNKFIASGVLLALCMLVLLSNYLDRIHTKNIKNSIATMYEDRLIAEDYILKMTKNVYEIREVLSADLNNASKSDAINKPIKEFNNWYDVYMLTKLTETEKTAAVELIGHFRNLEQQFAVGNYYPSNLTDNALLSLNKLSNVQLEESKSIMTKVESQYAAIKTTSRFAFAIVIIILLVLQTLVFSGRTIIPVVQPKDSRLN